MIITSKVDKNKYHSLVLDNKIKVLLVSNPEYTKSSCSLSVRVGSLDEPEEYPGLAHFLEHMLFMGTEKYPDENDFSDYLALHSGTSNAYTDNEVTVYYYDVDSIYFEGAADRFSQFFTSPLLAKESVEREILAVNSEFLNSLNNRAWRQRRLIEDLMLETRPEHRFNCGNLESLQKENILEAVRNFEKTHYSSDLMSLVICGQESIEDLENIARLFSNIKNINRKETVDSRMIDEPKPIFKPEYHAKIVQFAPLDDKKELSVNFILPRLREKFMKNPMEYIGFLLTTKEYNGLVSQIKKQKLGFELFFDYEHTLEYTYASIYVELTDLGCKEHQKVLNMIYSYILQLTADPKEYERLRKIKSEEFSFSQLESPIELTAGLCPDIHYYPIENILNYSFVFDDFDQSLITDTIQRLCDTSKWIILLSDKDGTFDRIESVYKVEYCILSDYVASKNNFIKTKSLIEDQFLENVDLLVQNPGRIYNNLKLENGEIHHVFDCKFNVPKSELFIVLSGLEIEKNLLATQIFFALASEFFSEQHARQLCNFHLDISIETSSTGVKIKFDGFSSKILAAAANFFNILENLSLDKFEIIRKEIEDFYSSCINNSPFRRTLEIFRSKFFSSKTSEELLEEVKLIKKDQIKIPSSFYVKILAVGNLEWEGIESFFKTIQKPEKKVQINSVSLLNEYNFETIDKFNNGCTMLFNFNWITQLPEPEINYEVETLDDESFKPSEYHYRSAVGHLLHQVSHELFFNQLRTMEQLGYIVSCFVRSFSSAQYLVFTVQSERSVEFLENRISEFIIFIKDFIKNMGPDEFNNFKESLACSYEEPIMNLEDLSGYCYSQLHTGSIDLNMGMKMASIVLSLTKEDLCNSDIFDSYVKVFSVKKNDN